MKAESILCAAAISFALALGMSFIHPFGNPRTTPAESQESLLQGAGLPDQARRVLVEKCADCHSNTTRWPLYSRMPGGSWLIERDVTQGRRHLNFSRWRELSDDQQQVSIAEIRQQIRKGSMPPLQYRLLHISSRLTAPDIIALSSLNANQAGDDETGPVKGDAARGKAVFERRCTGCHSLESDREGPHLRGVYGRKAGTVVGFSYSAAILASGVIWTGENIERWIRDSDAMLPGSAMGFSVPKVQDRADIVEFLKTQN